MPRYLAASSDWVLFRSSCVLSATQVFRAIGVLQDTRASRGSPRGHDYRGPLCWQTALDLEAHQVDRHHQRFPHSQQGANSDRVYVSIRSPRHGPARRRAGLPIMSSGAMILLMESPRSGTPTLLSKGSPKFQPRTTRYRYIVRCYPSTPDDSHLTAVSGQRPAACTAASDGRLADASERWTAEAFPVGRRFLSSSLDGEQYCVRSSQQRNFNFDQPSNTAPAINVATDSTRRSPSIRPRA